MDKQVKPYNTLLPIANTILAVLGITGTLLLVSGYAYKLGYITAFGVSIDALPISLNESISEAFYMGILFIGMILSEAKWVVVFIFGYIIFTFIVWLVLNNLKDGTLEKKLARWQNDHKSEAENSLTWQRYIFVVTKDIWSWAKPFLFIALISLSALFLVLLSPFRLGNEAGIRQIQDFREINYECSRLPEKGINCGQLIALSSAQIIAEGIIVSASSANLIVLFDEESISVFPRSPEHKLNILTLTKSQTQ